MSEGEKTIGGAVDWRYSCAMAETTGVGHRRECRFTGRVQGVGFRYTVKNLSMQYNVHGYVRNLPDGRVELVMEGPDEEMDSLLEDVNRKMNGYIRGVDQTVVSATGEFDYFAIRH
jgi:acylphosphatase